MQFNECLLSRYYMPSPVLGSGNTGMRYNRRDASTDSTQMDAKCSY